MSGATTTSVQIVKSTLSAEEDTLILNGRNVFLTSQCSRTEQQDWQSRREPENLHAHPVSTCELTRPREIEVQSRPRQARLSDTQLLEMLLTCDPTDSRYWMNLID